jgi:hypothetical protein
MIYLLERYEGQNTVPDCLIHCPLDEFEALYDYCHATFGAFRLTKFAEYSFGCGRIPFYDDEKNFDNLESRGIAPRPVSFEGMRNWGAASVRNLSQ